MSDNQWIEMSPEPVQLTVRSEPVDAGVLITVGVDGTEFLFMEATPDFADDLLQSSLFDDPRHLGIMAERSDEGGIHFSYLVAFPEDVLSVDAASSLFGGVTLITENSLSGTRYTVIAFGEGYCQDHLSDPRHYAEQSLRQLLSREADSVNEGIDLRHAAEFAHQYLRRRSTVEGVGYELTPDFFYGGLRMGVRSMFGLEFDEDGRPIRDHQEPSEGWFKAQVEEIWVV